MKSSIRIAPRPSQARWLSLVALGLAAGCGAGSGSGSGNFTPISTKEAVAPTTKIVVNGKWLAFQADEATSGAGGAGTDYNQDGDTTDQIAVVVNMSTKAETVLNVAVDEIAVVKNEIYFVVDEAKDNFDWNNDGLADDVVLVHYPKSGGGNSSPVAPNVEYVADVESSGNIHVLNVSDRLYFTRVDSIDSTLANGDTTLAYIDPLQPTTPVTITAAVTSFIHHPRILGQDEKLIALYEDEAIEALDLNNDTDQTDGFVLALLDGTDIASKVRSVGLAIRDESAPFRAKNTAAHDWLVGFLVNEAAQGDFPTGLNDITHLAGFDVNSKPQNCPTFSDTDTLDDVLHFLTYKTWNTNPVTHPPVNTGIAGRDKVLCVTGAVATIDDEGDEGGCDLNNDGDTSDEIVRWSLTSDPKHPYRFSSQLLAVNDGTPGGAFGVTDLSDKLIAVVDEAADGRNHDGANGTAVDNMLLGWRDPTDMSQTTAWKFNHSTSTTLYFGVPWLGENSPRDFARVAFQESVFAQDHGSTVDAIFGNGDGDVNDSLPSVCEFGSPTDLDFFWPKIAVRADNAGIVLFNNISFFRIDEAADKRDWNNDGKKNGFVLGRTLLNGADFMPLGTLNNIPGRNAVEGGGNVGAAWITDESIDLRDYDKNGVHTGLVVRWCRIGP